MAQHLMTKKHHIFLKMILFLSIFMVTLYFLLSINIVSTTEKNNFQKTIPTLYIHGWKGTAASTNHLIEAAVATGKAKKVLTITVSPTGTLTYTGKWQKKLKYPLIQVLFQNNQAEIPQQAKWINTVIRSLQTHYGISAFNIVSHSMGGPSTYYWAVHYYNRSYPQFNKFVPIAGPFDGVIYIDDSPNVNYFTSTGAPKIQDTAYKNYYLLRNKFPKETKILNIYGNLEDGTNSDSLVTTVSARSLAYLLKKRVAYYREVQITGANAQHSKLHNNATVNNYVDKFLFK